MIHSGRWGGKTYFQNITDPRRIQPGPLRNPEEKGTAFIHGPDNSVIDKILSLVESELSSPQPITITIYNSSCLYEPDHIKLIERFPAWAYLYRKYITNDGPFSQISLQNNSFSQS